MEGFVKRYFWTVNLAVLAVLAYLSARVVNNVAAGEIAALTTTPDMKIELPEQKRRPGYDPTSEWATTVTERNLFNANPPEPEVLTAVDDGEGEDEGPQRPAGAPPGPDDECEKSDAPFSLLATMVAEPSDWSMAVIDDGESDESRLVKEQQELADRTLVAIQRNRVVLANAGQFECVVLGEPAGRRGRRPSRTFSPSRPATSKADLKEGVKKVGKNQYEIDRGMLDEQLADLSALSRQARVIPHYRGGKPDGFKIVGVRPGSLYSHIGVRSGDIIKAVGDEEITSPNKALELYERLKNSDNVTVDIMRRGRKLTLEYDIK